MVRGAVEIVTPVPGTYQCAERQNCLESLNTPPYRSLGLGITIFINALMGLPCPKKIAGRISDIKIAP